VGLTLGVLLESEEGEPADESMRANPYAATELAELRRLTRAAVERLPEREREIVQRHYYQQWEFQDIAREIGVTKGRISQIHSQALARIRTLIQDAPRIDRQL
jgi:RNA polymerase sigma factor for flagellar operon FliA